MCYGVINGKFDPLWASTWPPREVPAADDFRLICSITDSRLLWLNNPIFFL